MTDFVSGLLEQSFLQTTALHGLVKQTFTQASVRMPQPVPVNLWETSTFEQAKAQNRPVWINLRVYTNTHTHAHTCTH